MNFLLRKSGGLFACFAKDYELLHDGSVFCVLSFADWKRAEFVIDGNGYVIRSDGKARWVLEHDGRGIASCRRQARGPRLEFSIAFDERVWNFKPKRSGLLLTHEIREGHLEIGRMTPRIRILWPEAGAVYTESPRLEVVAFAFWLMGIHWVGIAGKLTAGRAEMGT